MHAKNTLGMIGKKYAFCRAIGIGLLLLVLTGCGQSKPVTDQVEQKESLQDISEVGEMHYACTFDGVKHDFILDLPETVEGAPLVVALPGYGTTAEAFRNTIHFEEEACPTGYGVAYVTGSQSSKDDTSSLGWNSGIGSSETRDVDFLVAFATYLQDTYGFAPEKTYAIGFSNGGFMMHRLAMEAQDTYHACVAVAGMMPESVWNNRNEQNEVSFLQITGEEDDIVPKKSDNSANYTKAPAIEDVMDYWALSNALAGPTEQEIGKGSKWLIYQNEKKTQKVWHIRVKDGRHSWPEEWINGFDANTIILEFFESIS